MKLALNHWEIPWKDTISSGQQHTKIKRIIMSMKVAMMVRAIKLTIMKPRFHWKHEGEMLRHR